MDNKYKHLGQSGLEQLLKLLSTQFGLKVDKVEGMGLSTNDFSDDLKAKLEGIEEGANKYVHATHEEHGSGLYKITVDNEGHVTAVTLVTKDDLVDLGLPAQDTTYEEATQDAAGLQSAADKAKIDGIEAGAQVNVIEEIKVNGTAQTITDKSVDIAVPTGALANKDEVTESELGADLLAKINASTEVNHSHENKELLDTYTQTEADLADAVAKKHEHANAEELAKIADGDKAKWDQAVSDLSAEIERAKAAEEANTAAIEGLSDAKADRATTLAGYGIEDAYTKEEVDGLFDEKVTQADWDVSDESDPAYIKNRTHYLKSAVSTEYSASFTGTGHGTTMGQSQPGAPSYYLPEKVGQEFIVIYDGVEYACTLQSVQSGYTKIGLGDSSLVSYPFYITFEYSNVIGISIDVSTAGDHTIKVGQRYQSVKQLDEMFIPNTIARVSNLENVAEELSTEINTAIENLDVDTIARKDEVAQADWAENDENSPAYVKNRTHYTEAIKIIDGITVNCDESYNSGYKPSATIPNLLAPLENGKTYIVIFDDIEYRLVAREAWGNILIGNCRLSSPQAPETSEPFCVSVGKSSLSPHIYAKEQGIHTISIIAQDDLKYNQLDERFIPDTIARVSVVNTTINEGDSATLEASKDYADKKIATQISSAYKAAGSTAYEALPEASATNEGYVYNITNDFVTDEDFVEGAGNSYKAGTNVVVIDVDGTYMYDVLAMSFDGFVQEADIAEFTEDEISALWNSAFAE